MTLAASPENATTFAEELQLFRKKSVPFPDDVIEWGNARTTTS